MPSAERKVANATTVVTNINNNNVQVPANNQQPQQITKSGSIDTPMSPLQQVLVMVDKKVRNLDKRKTKLEQLKEQSKEAPKELTTEQRKAIAKCEEVVEILEFFKDFRKSINSLFLETQKAVKAKEAKEKAERAKEDREKVKNILLIQDLLNAIGTPDVRKALVSGSAGIEAISEERMKQLDDLYEILNPKRNEPGYVKNLEVAASRLNDLVEGKRKEAFKGVTFQELRDLILSLDKCPILAPPQPSSDRQQQQQNQPQMQESITNVSPSPPASNDHQQQQQSVNLQQQQQPSQHHNFVSFGSMDSSGTTDPAIVGIGFPPGVPISSAGIILPVGAYPVPLPGQLPQFVSSDGSPMYQQQPQQQQNLPDQQQSPPTNEFSGLNLSDQNKQIQGNERQGDSRFKGPRPPNKHWNRGPRDGAPRGDRGPRDNRTQGAPNDSQRYNNPRGPREHNNNFPNGGGGGFKGGNRSRNNNFNNGPRAAPAAAAGGFQKA